MLIVFLICLLASAVGSVCGIGGGIVIKPVLDAFGWMDVGTISFLSGCTVLSMSAYTVGRGVLAGDTRIEPETDLPLVLGAVVGGIAGKELFSFVRAMADNPDRVGAVQAVCLGIVTLATLLYTINKEKIRTHELKSILLCILTGFGLGILSSFLGIGGGPINLVALSWLFGMDTKRAAQSSLTIILFSQIASLLTALWTHTVPAFPFSVLLIMIAGGIGGGIIGRVLNRRMDSWAVDRMFCVLLVVIVFICVWNMLRYSS